jgi:hypothetical protein
VRRSVLYLVFTALHIMHSGTQHVVFFYRADASIIILNPMVAGLPAIVCHYGITCNSTTAAQQHEDIKRVYAAYQHAGLIESVGYGVHARHLSKF